jgi:outer membrane immunogenic protein
MTKTVLTALVLTALAAGPALGADLPALKAPPPPAPAFSWTGFYVGGNLGAAWGEGNLTDSLYSLTFDSGTGNGMFIGGGQAGFNYQFETLVVGLEAEFEGFANNHNSRGVFVQALGDTIAVSSNYKSTALLTARLGVAYNNWLFYGKGGGGRISNSSLTLTDLTTGTSISDLDNNRSVFFAGAGLEWAFVNNWTVKAEFEVFNVGSRTFTVPVGAPFLGGDTFTGTRTIQLVKLGFNYLFNWGPGPVTAY